MLHVKTTNQYNRATGKPKLGVKFKQHTRRQIVTKDKFAINLRDIGIGLRGSGLVLHPDGIGCCCFSFLASKIFISRSFFSKSNNLCCIPLGVFSINFCRKVGADDEDGPEFSPMSFSGINFLCIGNSFAITTKVIESINKQFLLWRRSMRSVGRRKDHRRCSTWVAWLGLLRVR